MLSSRSIIVEAEKQAFCALGGEVVILDTRAGEFYGLNSVAARIWHLIQQPARISDIQDAILAEYDVPPDRCEEDVLALLKDLADKGLVQVRDESPSPPASWRSRP